MEFSLFDFAKYDKQWWFSICGCYINDIYISILHVEHDQGMWKIDFIGLRALYFWLKNMD